MASEQSLKRKRNTALVEFSSDHWDSEIVSFLKRTRSVVSKDRSEAEPLTVMYNKFVSSWGPRITRAILCWLSSSCWVSGSMPPSKLRSWVWCSSKGPKDGPGKQLHVFQGDYIPFPWCSRYRRRKWTRRHEFKSWTWLTAFHIALIPLGKVWIQLFSLQLWVNNRTDWVLQPWLGN